jgi:Sulfotransferase family
MPGYVDEYGSGEILGWATDPDPNETLPVVICRAHDGRSMEFRAIHYRVDVCQAVGRQGTFGFAIPIEQIRHLGPKLRLYDSAGTMLDNGEVDLADLPDVSSVEQDNEKVHIFLHVQKSAGTSVCAALNSLYRRCEIALIYPGVPWISLADFPKIPLHQRQGFKFLAGHIYFGIHEYLEKPSRYVTVLRNPIDRLISNFWHHKNPDDNLIIDGIKIPIEQVVNEGLTEEFDNYATRVICGAEVPIGSITSEEVRTAIHNIDTMFDCLAILEKFPADFDRLCKSLGKVS